MNKTWIILMIMGIVILVGVTIYQFVLSIQGKTGDFAKPNVPVIQNDLGVEQLLFIESQQQNLLVADKDLDEK